MPSENSEPITLNITEDVKSTVNPTSVEKKSKKSKKKRCAVCRKSKNVLLLECKCGNYYCGVHRMFEAHNCTFDFKGESRKILENQLMAGKMQKTIESFS